MQPRTHTGGREEAVVEGGSGVQDVGGVGRHDFVERPLCFSMGRPVIIALWCILLLARAEDRQSLEAVFTAFATCTGDVDIIDRLQGRVAFFAKMSSEDEVKKLPEHVVRNEQEQIMALQEKLFPPGARCRLANQGTNGTIAACLRDGSFLCAVELRRRGSQHPMLVRAQLTDLRPRADCVQSATASPSDADVHAKMAVQSCDTSRELAVEGMQLPLSEEAIGQLMTDSVMEYHRLKASRAMEPYESDLGQSAFEDMPYAAMLIVLRRVHAASCVAWGGGDQDGAALAVDQALELERQARHEHKEVYELHRAIREGLSHLHYVLAAIKAARFDRAGADAAAATAQRLSSVHSSVSARKLQLALSATQQQRPRSQPGLEVDEVLRLQQWWHHELTPLEVGQEEEAASTPPQKTSAPRGSARGRSKAPHHVKVDAHAGSSSVDADEESSAQ